MLRKDEVRKAEGTERQGRGVPAGAGQEVPRRRQGASVRQEDEETQVAVRVVGLRKSYGSLTALDGVSFDVRRGSVFAYLGPNGAGKTTTINLLAGLLPRDAGEVSVCGLDVATAPVAVKSRIGVVTESSNLYPELRCRRNLEYLGELYGLCRSERLCRAGELIEQFGLAEKAGQPFGSLSRGMKRRLTIAAALVHRPEVLFLDEPTTGLDVPSARSLRELVLRVARDGTTVFLTTHNLAEAETLADDVAILIRGRIVARGTVGELRSRVGEARSLSVRFLPEVSPEKAKESCPSVRRADRVGDMLCLEVGSLHAAIMELADCARREGLHVEELICSPPSLEEAFVDILGEAGGAEEGES